MNIKIVISALLIIAAASGIYFFTKDNKSEVDDVKQSAEVFEKGKFTDLVNSNQDLKCTFNHDDGENISSGTVYFKSGGEKISADIDIVESRVNEMKLGLIRKDGFNYIWSDVFGGVKNVVTDNNSFFESSEDSPINEEDTEFNCETWQVDESVFELPEGVSFQEFSALNIDMNSNIENLSEIDISNKQCGLCDMIEDSGSANECRKAFQC